jgi:hypothetical protein
VNFTRVNANSISRTVVSTIAVTLTLTAFAQDPPPLHTPRRAVPGAIQSRYQEYAPRDVPANFNSAQGPGPGPIGPGPGCNVFPAPASVGAAVPLPTLARRLRRLIRAWSARCNC